MGDRNQTGPAAAEEIASKYVANYGITGFESEAVEACQETGSIIVEVTFPVKGGPHTEVIKVHDGKIVSEHSK